MILQKETPLQIVRETLKTKGVVGLYSGCTALVVGNSTKAAVRFLSYDYFKSKLADSQVRIDFILIFAIIKLGCYT